MSSLFKSFAFHIAMIALISLGFFFKDTAIPQGETAIAVSFVAPASGSRDEEKKPEPVNDLPPPIEDKPKPAPKALEQPKPPSAKPEIAEKQAEAQEAVERVTPKPLVKTPEEDKPKEVKKPDPAPKKPEVAKKDPPKDKEKPKDKDTTTGFTSLLKNLQDSEQPSQADPKKGPTLTAAPVRPQAGMTGGELDAFRMQLSQCWNILPGAAKAETLAVNLTISVNRDRTVRNVTITDTGRYQSDPFFRAAADNAIRAIKHPDCTPLDLPADKFDTWKELNLNFDPQSMF